MENQRRFNKRQRENSIASVGSGKKPESLERQSLNSSLVSPAIVKKRIKTDYHRTPEDFPPICSSNIKSEQNSFTPETPGSFASGLELSVDLGNASWADIVESEEREKKAAQRRSTPTKKDSKSKKSLFDYNFAGSQTKSGFDDQLKSPEELRRSPRKRKGDGQVTATTPNKTQKLASNPAGGVWDIRTRVTTDLTLSPLPLHRRPMNSCEDENSNSNFTRRISTRLHTKIEPSDGGKPVPIDFSSLATTNSNGNDMVHADVKDLREKLNFHRSLNGAAPHNSSFGMTTRSHDTNGSVSRGRNSRSSSVTEGSDIPPWELPIPDEKYTEPKNGWEKDPNTLARRQKEIDKGKNSAIYKRYAAEVPKKERIRGVHPKTPNKYVKTPRRSWDMQVRLWRKLLYCYDDPSKALRDVSFSSASDAGDSSYRGSSRSQSSVDESDDNMSTVSDEFNLSGVAEMREEEEGTFHEVINEETVTLQANEFVVKSDQTDFSQLLTQ